MFADLLDSFNGHVSLNAYMCPIGRLLWSKRICRGEMSDFDGWDDGGGAKSVGCMVGLCSIAEP